MNQANRYFTITTSVITIYTYMGGEKRLSYEPKAQSCSIFPPIFIYNERNYFEKKIKKKKKLFWILILNININLFLNIKMFKISVEIN